MTHHALGTQQARHIWHPMTASKTQVYNLEAFKKHNIAYLYLPILAKLDLRLFLTEKILPGFA